MRECARLWWVIAALPFLSMPAVAQPAVPAANAVAATVNGETIPEIAVQRGLKFIPPAKHAEARSEILNVLIDNVLVAQHLNRAQIAVDRKEVDARLAQFKNDPAEFDKMLKNMMMTEDELRVHVANELRWEKYLAGQANDRSLRDFFEKNPEMFDGTTVRARHILLTPNPGDAAANEAAKAQLLTMKQQILASVSAGLAKLPPNTDNLEREKERIRLTEEAFAALAKEKSLCPSKDEGGDVGWFARAGSTVEPFAKAAFALQPYQMSDVVTTQFGQHLILVTGRKPGKEVKFEAVKEAVKFLLGERLRESLCAQLRQNARIQINPPPKP